LNDLYKLSNDTRGAVKNNEEQRQNTNAAILLALQALQSRIEGLEIAVGTIQGERQAEKDVERLLRRQPVDF
jgi:hypothetical protein